jgi:1-deoxy-D-xylulose-5-phosphate reductoisomerase
VTRLAVLGSTGSIGRQTLEVVRWHPHELQVVALAAARASPEFEAQTHEFQPRLACLTSRDGPQALTEIATHPDVDLLVVATSGVVGFAPTLAALEKGIPVALANKETLIMAGHLVTQAAARSKTPLLPIDSEHSAIWQCLRGEEPYAERVRRLLLTASGGALRDQPIDALAEVTPDQALQHPTWSMGKKITVDSATLMNKGLEVIEAHWLFQLPFECIEVVIHHQSVIHSLVEFVDGSVKAQLGLPDMRLPIQYALTYPRRLPAPVQALDLAALGSLTFGQVDPRRYPCLALACEAGRRGGTFPTVLNAANEEAVARFFRSELRFTQIAMLIEDALAAHPGLPKPSLEEVLSADAAARGFAREWQPRIVMMPGP